jgi:hypothetical protein
MIGAAMALLRRRGPWRPAHGFPLLVLGVAVVASMIRALEQPGVELDAFGSELRIVVADAALIVLAGLCVARLLGTGTLPRPARAPAAAAVAFAAWMLLSSLLNGADAFVGASKVLLYGVLALGVVLFVQRRPTFVTLLGVLVAVNTVAATLALTAFLRSGERQGAFLGEHDLAALSTLSLAVGLAPLFAGVAPRPRLTLVALGAGTVGLALSAAVASLLGLVLALGALTGLALARGTLSARAAAAAAAVLVVTFGATYAIRGDDLGFLRAAVDPDRAEALPGQYSGSWSHRLIYVYLGGRVFLDNPVAGTGWHGELPPDEWARFLPDARARFPDEPRRYFPDPERPLIPQQTYDQVLYELGLVGAALFLALGVLAVRAARRVGRRWPRGGPDEELAFVPLAWVGALAGALAGAALFGGNPLTALFWLVLGVVALAPSLLPTAAR